MIREFGDRDEEAYEMIGACQRLLDAIVVEHGGRVEEHAGDCVVALPAAARATALSALRRRFEGAAEGETTSRVR